MVKSDETSFQNPHTSRITKLHKPGIDTRPSIPGICSAIHQLDGTLDKILDSLLGTINSLDINHQILLIHWKHRYEKQKYGEFRYKIFIDKYSYKQILKFTLNTLCEIKNKITSRDTSDHKNVSINCYSVFSQFRQNLL